MALARKYVALIVLLILALVGAIAGYARWRHNQVFVTTENAYVHGPVYTVASRIQGKIATLPISENQYVKEGDVIATIDPSDYDAAVARAQASLAEAEAALAMNGAAIAQARAQVEAIHSQLDLAVTEKKRAESLLARQSIPKQKVDQAVTQEAVTRAQLEAAKKTVAQASASEGVSKKRIEVAQAALNTALLQRSYCTVAAPASGYISRKMTETGQVLAAGQPICAIVPLDVSEIWVEANYKETQLKNVRPGQRVKLRADIDKSRVYSGTVESLSAGTGAAFSLLPPENATGNWVKVVQRLPVRIKIDPASDPDHQLRVGLTVTCEIDTRN